MTQTIQQEWQHLPDNATGAKACILGKLISTCNTGIILHPKHQIFNKEVHFTLGIFVLLDIKEEWGEMINKIKRTL